MADKRTKPPAQLQPLRLPQVDKLLRHPEIQALEKKIRRDCLANLTRQVLDEYRQEAQKASDTKKNESKNESKNDERVIDEKTIVRSVLRHADSLLQGSLQKVINGSGVILNTNLGRAPLPLALVEKLTALMAGYSSLEIDMDSGSRGERAAAIERLLVVLTGCEAAIVVNNNAAAVLLVVNALASGREVIVSRGELIEIGGSFRLPDVIVSGGAILKEVGTTNRTRAADYAKAINENTGFVLKCHRSNFEISGFTEEASLEELKKLTQEKQVPLIEDLGSGALIDLTLLNSKEGARSEIKYEQTVPESTRVADVVMFSGDKLLGGSQAGLIVGKRDLIKRLRSHPTYRALRLDKLNIALLELTLAEYLRPDAIDRLPVYKMAAISEDALEVRAADFVSRLKPRLRSLRLEVTACDSAFGGGTMPNVTIKSRGLKLGIAPGAPLKLTAHKLGSQLRQNRPAILTLTSHDSIIIDLRTVDESEESAIEMALAAIDDSLSN